MKIWALVASLFIFGTVWATRTPPELAEERYLSGRLCLQENPASNTMHKRRGCIPSGRRHRPSPEAAAQRYQPQPRQPLCPPSVPISECAAAAPLRALLLVESDIPREKFRQCSTFARVEGPNQLRSALVGPLPRDILLLVHAVDSAPPLAVLDAIMETAGNVSVFVGASRSGGGAIVRRCQILEPRCSRLSSLLPVIAWLAADDRLDAYDARWLSGDITAVHRPESATQGHDGQDGQGLPEDLEGPEDTWPRLHLSPWQQLEKFAERLCSRGRSQNRFIELLPASAVIEEDPGPTMSPETALSLGDILPINPKNYDKNRAPKLAGQATVVYFHVTVLSLDSINEESMTYVADIFLAQSWRDPRLRLPENMSEEYRILDVEWLHNIWRPDCFFKNAKKVTFHEMSIPNHYLWLYHDKTLLYMSKLTLVLSCAMKFESYPHDTQICSMSIESLSHTVHDLVFIWNMTDPLVVNPEIELPQLDISNNYTADCTIEYSTGNFTCLAVVFNLRRRLGYHLFHSYIPSALIVIMSWISFWIKPEAIPARVTLGVTSLLTLATQNTQSQQSLPPVSYVKAIDVWMSSCSVFVFLSLMEFAIVNNYMGPVATKAMKGYSEQDIQAAVDEFKDLEPSGRSPTRQSVPTVPQYDTFCHGRETALFIDKCSRFIFPTSFLVLNVVYWSTFLSP